MIKQILKALCLGFVLVATPAAAQVNIDAKPQKHAAQLGISTGHNLQLKRQAEAALKADAPMKGRKAVAAKPASTKGVSATSPLKSKRRALEVDYSGCPFFESFEDCAHRSPEMPNGWTLISNSDHDDPAWTDEGPWQGISREYAEYYMFPLPSHGNMMVGVFYNDEMTKDEWLVSPEVEIPSEGYALNFDWYTVPLYFFAIDRFHVDYDNGVFIDREVICDVEVLVKTEGSEWTKIHSLTDQYADLEYADFTELDFLEMQTVSLPLSEYVGKKIQVAFRYVGREANTFMLDNISVGLTIPKTLAYEPNFSRLFFGFSPDENLYWFPTPIEFYPVNYPVYWFNTTPAKEKLNYEWHYFNFDERGNYNELVDNDPEYLAVVYQPDYTSEAYLMNNVHRMPELHATNDRGGKGIYTNKTQILQAGGTTEFNDEEEGYAKYVATLFDPETEGFSLHLEGDDELGFYLEPIFGYSENTDAWWEHYCFKENEQQKKAYVDGFANLFIPDAEAPMVVNGVSAVAVGTANADVELTLTIYATDEDGNLIEPAMHTQSMRIGDMIKFPTGMGKEYFVMNFNFDEPLIFSADNTGVGFVVMISGYHNEGVQYFAPVQSITPNEYEWALGYYRLKHPNLLNISEEISQCCYFKDDDGDDLYTTFAIGVDAHYPWLELADDNDNITIDSAKAQFNILGYYGADKYTSDAPAWLDVTFKNRYTTEVTVKVLEDSDKDRTVPLTISAPGVSTTVNLLVKGGSGSVDSVVSDEHTSGDIFNLQGMRIRSDASAADLHALPAGLYIYGGRKVMVK